MCDFLEIMKKLEEWEDEIMKLYTEHDEGD